MSFEDFLLNKIFPVFSYIINWSSQMLNLLMSNYIFKIIIYIGLAYFIINVIKSIINLIFFKTSTSKDKGD